AYHPPDPAPLSRPLALHDALPTSTVTYRFFTNNACTVPADGSEAQPVAVNGDVTDSSPSAALGVGSYSYKASYSGNANYDAATSDCEPLKVATATPTLATTVKDAGGSTVDNAHPAPLGSKVHATATLSGGVAGQSFDGTATVTYRFFTNNACTVPDRKSVVQG